VPVFLFEVRDRTRPKGPDASFAGSVQCVVLHDSAEEALASIKEFVPHADVSLSKETADLTRLRLWPSLRASRDYTGKKRVSSNVRRPARVCRGKKRIFALIL
jgi:hypothetical protein